MPNVTAIDAAEVIERVQGMVDRIAGVIRFMAGASILAGLVILGGSIAATRFRRVREAAILKSLGATRGMLLRSLAIEYVTLGVLAGRGGHGGRGGAVVGGADSGAQHPLARAGAGARRAAAGDRGVDGARRARRAARVIAEKPLAVLRGE
jgi:hypothetical protein